jgi:hypothetical protein
MSEIKTQRMRIYHRYLGYFLAGIMAVYSISGLILIFRDTDFFKVDKMIERQLRPGIESQEVGKEIRIKDFKVEKEEGDVITFKQGTYNKATGVAKYTAKELPYIADKLTRLHKADTKKPLFFLNIFFGLSLLFFVISAFWMFLPNTKIFKKGLLFALGGVALALVLIFI